MSALRSSLMTPPLHFLSQSYTVLNKALVPSPPALAGAKPAPPTDHDASTGKDNLRYIQGTRLVQQADFEAIPPPPPLAKMGAKIGVASPNTPLSELLKYDLQWSNKGPRKECVDVYYKAVMQAKLYEVEMKMREQAGGKEGKVRKEEVEAAGRYALDIERGHMPLIIRQPSEKILLQRLLKTGETGAFTIRVVVGCFAIDGGVTVGVRWEKDGKELPDVGECVRKYWWGYEAMLEVGGSVPGDYVAVVESKRSRGGKIVAHVIKSKACEVSVKPGLIERFERKHMYALGALGVAVVEFMRFTGVQLGVVQTFEMLLVTAYLIAIGRSVFKGERKTTKEKGPVKGPVKGCECCQQKKTTKKKQQQKKGVCMECMS